MPQETLDKYSNQFQDADQFFHSFMKKHGVPYYNYNYTDVKGFDRSLKGFSDYEGHMYEDQSDLFSEEIGKKVKEM